MTAKEKAEDIVDSFVRDGYDIVLDEKQAKRCALITIDEMLKHMSLHFGQIGLSTVEYWSEVKKEIEQL